jgi:hypothetical protein
VSTPSFVEDGQNYTAMANRKKKWTPSCAASLKNSELYPTLFRRRPIDFEVH